MWLLYPFTVFYVELVSTCTIESTDIKFEMTLVFNVYTKTTLSMQLNLNMFGNSCTENAFFSSILSEVPFFYFNLLIYFKVNFKFGFILLRYIVIHCCFFIWIIIQSSKNKDILWLDFPLRFHTIFFYCLEIKIHIFNISSNFGKVWIKFFLQNY